MKKIIEYSSVLTAFLLFISISRNIIYWRKFNISILHYLNFSDIINHAFDVVYQTLIYFFLVIIIFYLFRNAIFSSKKVPLYLTIPILAISIVAALLIYYECDLTKNYNRFILESICFIGLISFSILAYRIFNNIDKEVFFVSLLFAFAYSITRVEAKYQILAVTKHKQFFGTTIYFDDPNTIFVSDSTHYYIGATENFVFGYDEKLDSTYIFKMTDINKISIRTRGY